MRAKLFLIALACLTAHGQSVTPSFEVASIKPATPLGPRGMRANRNGGPGTADPGRYVCENCPIYWVLSEAYDLESFEYAGPDWVHSARFDFAAKIPNGATKDSLRVMLQNLLAERFKLVVHREKKEMQVYEMTVAKNGPKFRESAPKETPKQDGPPGQLQRDRDGFPILTGGVTMAIMSDHARLRSDNQPIAWFVRMLVGQLDGPVIDATGLTGKYDFVLSWSADEEIAPTGDAYPHRSALIRALPSQLGLRLEQKKGQVEVLVVDHLEKTPTAN